MQDFVHQPYDTELVLWLGGSRAIGLVVWEFPKIGVPYFGVLIIRILLCFGGTILGSPSFGNSHLGFGPSMVPVPTAHPRQTALPRLPDARDQVEKGAQKGPLLPSHDCPVKAAAAVVRV